MSSPGFPSQALTAREKEIALLLAEGLSMKEIATAVHLSARTVEFHKASITRKIGARSVALIVRYVIRQGWILP